MRHCGLWILLAVSYHPSLGIEWTSLKPKVEIIKSKIPNNIREKLPSKLPHNLPANLRRLPTNVRSNIGAALTQDVDNADIRLIKKDPTKTSKTHPILSEARISKEEATSIFVTEWDEYVQWGFTLDTEYKPVKEAALLLKSDHYNASLDTLLILHDRCGNAKDGSMVKILKALELRNFNVNFNIFLLDFKGFMCKAMPNTGLFKVGFNPQVQVLGAAIAEMLDEGLKLELLQPDQIHMIGLGFSAHLAGLVSKYLYRLCGEPIRSILALDPPVRLIKKTRAKRYAETVHVYHTYTLLPGMGPRLGLGTANFVFDGAKIRPECNSFKGECFSSFGAKLLMSTLLFPKQFPARWCPDFSKFINHFCDINDYAYVSFPPDSNTTGTHQLNLGADFPYGLGPEGIFMTKEEMGEPDSPDSLPTVDLSTLSPQEFKLRFQQELLLVRNDVMVCLQSGGMRSQAVAIKCVLDTQPHVKRMVDQGFMRKGACEPMSISPTGKKCQYETRDGNEFFLPF